jgi:hypothetical protein
VFTNLLCGDASLANRHHSQPQEPEDWHRRSDLEHRGNGAPDRCRAIAHDHGQMRAKSILLMQRLPWESCAWYFTVDVGARRYNTETASWFAGVVGKFASFVADLTENSASNPVRKFFVKRVEKVTDN